MDEFMESQVLKKLIVMSSEILQSTDEYYEIQANKLARIERCNSEALKERMMKEFHKEIREYKKQAELLIFEYQKVVCESEQISKEFLLKMRKIQKIAAREIEIRLSGLQIDLNHQSEERCDDYEVL